jgi:hypothetical protein
MSGLACSFLVCKIRSNTYLFFSGTVQRAFLVGGWVLKHEVTRSMLEISTIAWMALLLLEVMSEIALVQSSKKLNKLN